MTNLSLPLVPAKAEVLFLFFSSSTKLPDLLLTESVIAVLPLFVTKLKAYLATRVIQAKSP